MEHLSVTNHNKLPARGSIAELVELAKQEGHNVSEIGVWESATVEVPEGEVGVIPTEALNGCHASIIVAGFPDGQKSVSMTHFPPEMGAQRYIESLEGIQESILARGGKAETVVSFVASDRRPKEVIAVQELFPNVNVHELSYKARDKARKAHPDAGRCLAVLDRRDASMQTLHVATDSGDLQLQVA